MDSKRIFVTVGTTRFDKLCETILSPKTLQVFKSFGYNRITIQIGNDKKDHSSGSYNGVDVEIYRFKDSIISDISEADLVISHAGAGSCLEVLDAGKPLLVVINTDLMDNHQTEIAKKLHSDGNLYYCTCDTLCKVFSEARFDSLKRCQNADTTLLFDYLNNFLGFTK